MKLKVKTVLHRVSSDYASAGWILVLERGITMDYQEILFDVDTKHVCTITINRPERMNTFTPTMMDEFKHAWLRVAEDDNIHSVVLRASECRAFSTGVDVNIGVKKVSNIWSKREPGESLGPKANKVWKPVICAVHGLACWGAFYWLNESDIVICSDDAEFFDPHVTFGRTAALEPIGAIYKMPLGEVLRMTLMGNDERIGAATALRLNLVSEVVPRAELWDRAYELARIIAEKPAAAVQGSVRAIWESLDEMRTVALARGQSYCDLGNPIGMAEVEAGEMKKPDYVVR